MPGASKLSPAYLIVGADQLKRDTAVKRLIARLGDAADFNLDRRTITAADDPSDLIGSLNQLPFAAPFRLVLIDNGGSLPKAVSEAIINYLKNPSPTTVLCLVAEKLAKGTRLYKAVAKAGPHSIVDCTPKKRRELPAQVRAMATAHGKTITMDAAEELISRVGESTVMLDAQLASLAALTGQRDPIKVADVQQFVARTEEVKPWDLVDAICDRNVPEALQLLHLMESTSPVLIHSFLTGRLRELICARACLDRGESGAIASKLGRQSWQVRNHVRWARNYSMRELEHALAGARDCERQLKGSGDSQTALLLWICDLMT